MLCTPQRVCLTSHDMPVERGTASTRRYCLASVHCIPGIYSVPPAAVTDLPARKRLADPLAYAGRAIRVQSRRLAGAAWRLEQASLPSPQVLAPLTPAATGWDKDCPASRRAHHLPSAVACYLPAATAAPCGASRMRRGKQPFCAAFPPTAPAATAWCCWLESSCTALRRRRWLRQASWVPHPGRGQSSVAAANPQQHSSINLQGHDRPRLVFQHAVPSLALICLSNISTCRCMAGRSGNAAAHRVCAWGCGAGTAHAPRLRVAPVGAAWRGAAGFCAGGFCRVFCGAILGGVLHSSSDRILIGLPEIAARCN